MFADVEKVHIDVDSAVMRFKGRLINADNVGQFLCISTRGATSTV